MPRLVNSLAIALILFGAPGCHPLRSQLPSVAGPGNAVKKLVHSATATPKNLKSFSSWLTGFALVSLVGIAVGVAIAFSPLKALGISPPIAAGSGTLLVTSLFLKVSLWVIPAFMWLLIGVFTVALAIFIFKVYTNVRSKKPTSLMEALDDIPKAIEETIGTRSIPQLQTVTNGLEKLPGAHAP